MTLASLGPGSTGATELAQGRWHELPGTRLVDVAPDPIPRGVEGVSGVMDDWSGAVFDSRRERLILWGGGHAGYAGNEIYAFDVATRSWSVIWGPTPNEQIPERGGPHETYLDGSPGARHTYDNMIYDPQHDALWVTGGSVWRTGSQTAGTWRFHFGTGAWERLQDNPKASIFSQTAYDPSRKIIMHRVPAGISHYDPADDRWRKTNDILGTHWHLNGEFDPVARKFVMVGGERFDIYDPDKRRFQSPKASGDTEIVAAMAPGLAYHPRSGGIVAWAGGARLYLLDIDKRDYRWRAIDPAPGGVSPGKPNRNGTYGRFRYVPSLDAFVLVNNVDENVFLYRLPGASPASPAAKAPPRTSAAPEPVSVADQSVIAEPVTATAPPVSRPETGNTREPGAPIVELAVRRVDKRSANNWLTFGSIFLPGDLPAASGLVARTGSTDLPTQFDAKVTHPDGSVRHGIVTVNLADIDTRREQALTLYRTERRHGVSLPKPADGLDATISIVEGGRRYRASAGELLAATPPRRWLDGPLVGEWHVSAPLRAVDDGSEHSHLAVHFYLRRYAGQATERVDVVLENSWTLSVTPRNVRYDLEIDIDGDAVFREQDVNHYRHARWRKTFWRGDTPAFFIAHNTEQLIESGVVPHYDPGLRIDETSIAKVYDRWMHGLTRGKFESRSTMGAGLLYPGMHGTGDRPDIGPLPRWTVQYLLTMDPRAKAATLGTADQAGSFPAHFRDRDTGQPFSIVDYPETSLAAPKHGPHPMPLCVEDCDVPYLPDLAHQPSMSFIPYLVTGDFYHLEEMLFWGTYIHLSRSPVHRRRDKGLIQTHQVRGQAWSLRTLAHIDWLLPDAHPQKGYWSTMLHNNLDYYLQRYVGIDGRPPTDSNALGIITEGTSWPPSRRYTPWMDDFFTWATGYVVNLGYEKFRPMLEFKASHVIERLTNPEFCWIFAALHPMNFRDSANAPEYDSYARLYEESVDAELRALPCGSMRMGAAIGMRKGEMLRWRREPPRGFPQYLQIGLAAAVDSGHPGGAAAWQRWEQRVNPHDRDASPEWSIVPRTLDTNGTAKH